MGNPAEPAAIGVFLRAFNWLYELECLEKIQTRKSFEFLLWKQSLLFNKDCFERKKLPLFNPKRSFSGHQSLMRTVIETFPVERFHCAIRSMNLTYLISAIMIQSYSMMFILRCSSYEPYHTTLSLESLKGSHRVRATHCHPSPSNLAVGDSSKKK